MKPRCAESRLATDDRLLQSPRGCRAVAAVSRRSGPVVSGRCGHRAGAALDDRLDECPGLRRRVDGALAVATAEARRDPRSMSSRRAPYGSSGGRRGDRGRQPPLRAGKRVRLGGALVRSYLEGLAEENKLAKRGYSRDHRGDCEQIVLALVVTREGFPLAHYTLAGNTQDVETVQKIVTAVESPFGKSQRVWVMDRGMMSKENLDFLSQSGRRYLIGTRRSELANFGAELRGEGWLPFPDEVEVKPVERDGVAYLLARSTQRKKKERAIRKRQLLGLHRALKRLAER